MRKKKIRKETGNFNLNILAMDIGASTQKILLYDDSYASSYRIVMPSPSTILSRRIRQCTSEKREIVLLGDTMGGGAIEDALLSHMHAGYKVNATECSTMTFMQGTAGSTYKKINIIRIEEGMAICTERNAQGLLTRDVDRDGLSMTFSMYNLTLDPETIAVAVKDSGMRRNDELWISPRAEFFRKSLPAGIRKLAFETPPEYFPRMEGVKRTLIRDFPDSAHLIMDTKAAAVFGCLRAANTDSGIFVESGSMNTVVASVENSEITGIIEMKTENLSPKLLEEIILAIREGTLDKCGLAVNDAVTTGVVTSPYTERDIYICGSLCGSVYEKLKKSANRLDYHINTVPPVEGVDLFGTVGLVEAAKSIG